MSLINYQRQSVSKVADAELVLNSYRTRIFSQPLKTKILPSVSVILKRKGGSIYGTFLSTRVNCERIASLRPARTPSAPSLRFVHNHSDLRFIAI